MCGDIFNAIRSALVFVTRRVVHTIAMSTKVLFIFRDLKEVLCARIQFASKWGWALPSGAVHYLKLKLCENQVAKHLALY